MRGILFILAISFSPMLNALGIGVLANLCDGDGVDFCGDQVLAEVYLDHSFDVGAKGGLEIPIRLSHESKPEHDDLRALHGKDQKSGFINKIGVGLYWRF